MTHSPGFRFPRWTALVCALAILAMPQPAQAQQPQQTRSEQPGETTSNGWVTESTPGQPAEQQQEGQESQPPLDARPPFVPTSEQLALIRRINAYLTGLQNVKGNFTQTNHRNEVKSGQFYVKRPGRLRFDYDSPSKMRIVSDGEYLSIEDHDLKTVDKYPLDATPIQLLLGEDVDLMRDAVLLDMRQDETAVVLLLRNKTGTSSGILKLFFKLPELELYEWVITDAQGLDTRIQLADLQTGQEKSKEFFEASSIELQKVWNQ